MKKIAFILLTLLSACSEPKLIVMNGTDYNVQLYLAGYSKQFSSKYTILPAHEMVVGEYKDNTCQLYTTPYMIIRERNVVTDSILDLGNKDYSTLSVMEQDSLRLENNVVDSIFLQLYKSTHKKRPKTVVWYIQDNLFDAEYVKNMKGMRLSSGRYINQEVQPEE